MRQRLPPGPLPPRRRAALLRIEIGAPNTPAAAGQWYLDNLSQFGQRTETAAVVWQPAHLCVGTRVDDVRRRAGCGAGIRHRAFLRGLRRKPRKRSAWVTWPRPVPVE